MTADEILASVPSTGPAAFRAGDVVCDRYELMSCIGAGALGAVFRARDRRLDIDVAIKLIRLDPERDDVHHAARRLRDEARAIARISHPGIVRVFDFSAAGEVPFIVMELLEGESLARVLVRQGRMTAEAAVGRLLPVADALAVAHQRGVVHRDVKPENIILARDELGRLRAKLLDFGVARLVERRGFTRPGALLGTPDYMAPEQAQSSPDVDHRADVWSLGVVLYELVTGERPFAGSGASYFGVLRAIVSDAPRPITELGAGDAVLERILRTALAKPAARRYRTMRAFGEALAAWLLSRGIEEDAGGAALRSQWLAEASDSVPAKM